ncbi:MAG TPA: FHA domain-containing protein [Candidatus Thermoplasmatota archaeon]|nr:FHA domain-containing protein [Candidatus Thermoplasmatota archaeon]
MPGAGLADEIDFERLEAFLKVLATTNRLELLSLLRRPKTLDEIRLTPAASQAAGSPDRAISRQAVQGHLDRLIDVGLVRVASTERKGKRAVQEYALDHARLFAVLEEMRKLSRLESTAAVDPFATESLGEGRPLAWEDGPKVVIVHGVREGRAFPLKASAAKAPRGWIIGRAADAHVPLEYDPFVSTENSEIVKTAEGFRLLDLRTARNGTYLNWNRLPVGGSAPLESGDVIGVGRSLVVFRES